MRLTNIRDVVQVTYQVLAATTLILAAVIGYHQLQANESIRRAQAVGSLIELWDSAEQRQARRIVNSMDFSKLTTLSDLPSEQRSQVDAWLNTSNHIAYQALTGIVPVADVAQLFGPGMVGTWDRVAPLVQVNRARGDTRFLGFLETFVTKYRGVIPPQRPLRD